MKPVTLIAMVLAVVAGGIPPALAHRPYFTQAEKIRLPNGGTGEVRLLNGDGIIGPDPVRALILDDRGRLLARSPESSSMRISCRGNGECLIFDLAHDTVLEPEAGSFRQGDRVPVLTEDDRSSLWALEDGDESWGFHTRPLASDERSAALMALMQEHFPTMIFNAVVGGFCWLLVAAAWIVVKAERTHAAQVLIALVSILVLVALALFAVFVSFVWSAMSAVPFAVWALSLVAGKVIAAMGHCFLKRGRSASTPHAGSIA